MITDIKRYIYHERDRVIHRSGKRKLINIRNYNCDRGILKKIKLDKLCYYQYVHQNNENFSKRSEKGIKQTENEINWER